MMRRLLAAAALAAVVVPLAASPAAAADPAVHIIKIFYDAPGKDTRSNASLNGEYVQVKNMGRKTINLGGWALRDFTGYKFRFPEVVIKPGKVITIRTGSGKSGASTLYWGRRQYVWNNDADLAYLVDKTRKLIDSCSYTPAIATTASYTTC
jgi:hypothetical protein